MFPVSGDVGKFSISDASNWKLLLAHEGCNFSVGYEFSGWLLRSLLAPLYWVVAILISGIRSRDTALSLAFLKSLTPKMGVQPLEFCFYVE